MFRSGAGGYLAVEELLPAWDEPVAVDETTDVAADDDVVGSLDSSAG